MCTRPQVESDVLFRALRDFNIPKILSQDMVIFMGLLNDLFPGVDPPRKRDHEFEEVSDGASWRVRLRMRSGLAWTRHASATASLRR